MVATDASMTPLESDPAPLVPCGPRWVPPLPPLVATGFGSDHGDFDLAAADEFPKHEGEIS